MQRYFLFLLFLLSSIVCFADYSDRGRPTDFQEPHDGPLTYIFMAIGAFILLAIIGYWIYDKIRSHKEQISETLGTIFAGALIFGGILLVGKCGESFHDSINSGQEPEKELAPSSNSTQSQPAYPSNNQTISRTSQPTYTPTIHYRTVEYYDNCYTCNGSGRVLCPKCQGTGRTKKTCDWCKGSGGHCKKRCFDCNGKGYIEDNVFGSGRHYCINCGGTGDVDTNCQRCSGTGYESEICDIYAVYENRPHYVTCHTCNGNGQVRRTRQESYYE